MFQLCQPSCTVPIVSLLRPRRNKPVLANRQKALVQCSNCVTATASHKQACSCQSPERPRAMFQVCHCYGLGETNLFLPISRGPSCNVPLVSLLRPRMIKLVLANRQKAFVQMFNGVIVTATHKQACSCQSPKSPRASSKCVIATASHKQACSCQSPESPRAMFQLCRCYGLADSNLFLPIARKPSCSVPIGSLLRPIIIKPVLANRQKALVQCSNCVTATASHHQTCSCETPESPRALFQLCHCYHLA